MRVWDYEYFARRWVWICLIYLPHLNFDYGCAWSFAYSLNEVVQESELEIVRTQLQVCYMACCTSVIFYHRRMRRWLLYQNATMPQNEQIGVKSQYPSLPNLNVYNFACQVAQAQVDEAANMRRRLNNEPIVETNSRGSSATEISKKTAAAIAAEVADKLAASSRSQQIMTSVLSTFAAEEAKNTAIASSSLSEVTHDRVNVNLEKPLPSSAAAPAFVSVPLQHQTVLVQQGPIQNQASTPQPPYNLYPAATQQYLQPTGGVMIGVPYTYSNLPPPPPPPQMLNMARPGPMPPQQPMAMIQQPPAMPPTMALQQPAMPPMNQQLALQQPAPPSYRPLQPPGMQFFHHQSQWLLCIIVTMLYNFKTMFGIELNEKSYIILTGFLA